MHNTTGTPSFTFRQPWVNVRYLCLQLEKKKSVSEGTTAVSSVGESKKMCGHIHLFYEVIMLRSKEEIIKWLKLGHSPLYILLSLVMVRVELYDELQTNSFRIWLYKMYFFMVYTIAMFPI